MIERDREGLGHVVYVDINADGRQIAFPTNAPPPLANLHVTLLEA